VHASYLLTTYLPRGAVPRIDAACAATGAHKRWVARPAVAAPLLASETLQLVKDATVFAVTAHSDARVGFCLDVNGRETKRGEFASGEVDLDLLDVWLQAFEALVHEHAQPIGE
jgi:hypothetical protein